jgi:hypothetical protein
MDCDHPTEILRLAQTCSRLADQCDDRQEADKLRQMSLEYDAKARGLQSPPLAPASEAEPTAQQRALAILREFEQARSNLIGKTVVSSDGKAGSVEKVLLEDLHGLRIIIGGHEGDWPISTLKFVS